MRPIVTVVGFLLIVANAALLGFLAGQIRSVPVTAVQERVPTSRIETVTSEVRIANNPDKLDGEPEELNRIEPEGYEGWKRRRAMPVGNGIPMPSSLTHEDDVRAGIVKTRVVPPAAD